MNLLTWAPPWVGPTFLSVYLSWAYLMQEATSSFSCVLFDGANATRAWPRLRRRENKIQFSDASDFTAGLFFDQSSLISYLGQHSVLGMPIWIVVLPTLIGLIEAKRLVNHLLDHGIHSNQIHFLMTELEKPYGLPSAFIEKELGPIHFRLPYDPLLSFRAEQEGKFLSELAPRSKIVSVLKKWAQASVKQIQKNNTVQKGQLSSASSENFLQSVIEGVQKRPSSSLENPIQRIRGEVNSILLQNKISYISDDQRSHLESMAYDQLFGLGPLESLMRDPDVTDIMVNGSGETYVERNGCVEIKEKKTMSSSQVKTMIDRVVARAGRRVDHNSPLCDVRLSDGSRANVVLPPISLHGPLLTIRRFRKKAFRMEDLIRKGTLTSDQANTLKIIIQERNNVVVAGNTGSGKTTLLNTLSQFVDPHERIITVEDTAELQLTQPHVVQLETRPRNLEGQGEITLNELVINSLRMRPDRIIVGECRGKEVIPMLQSMNTGHDGALTTLHANSADEVMPRLESLILLAAPQWPLSVIREQIKAAIDVIVFMKRDKGHRVVQEIRFLS